MKAIIYVIVLMAMASFVFAGQQDNFWAPVGAEEPVYGVEECDILNPLEGRCDPCKKSELYVAKWCFDYCDQDLECTADCVNQWIDMCSRECGEYCKNLCSDDYSIGAACEETCREELGCDEGDIPEFTLIGALVAIAGIGLLIYQKRF